MRCRLKLFDATVGSCALWCCRSWTPRLEELRQLRVAWHSMLRRICGQRRAPDEDYVVWIQRCTRRARLFAERAGVREWVHSFASYKWAWAGHAARRPAETWLAMVMEGHSLARFRLESVSGNRFCSAASPLASKTFVCSRVFSHRQEG